MIVLTARLAPAVHRAASSFGLRPRPASCLLPYQGYRRGSKIALDSWSGQLSAAPLEAAVAPGPADPEAWREVLPRRPVGAVGIGPAPAGEEIYRAALAAGRAVAAAGRGRLWMDVPAATVALDGRTGAAAVFSWHPLEPLAWDDVADLASRGFEVGISVLAVPGWTLEPDFLDAIVGDAASRGASFVSLRRGPDDPVHRRLAVEACEMAEPTRVERVFDLVHHADPEAQFRRAEARLCSELGRLGLSARLPRPVGDGEFAANIEAAEALDRLADREGEPHRSARLRAASRWLEELDRDAAALHREGNLAKVLPFEREIVRCVLETLGSDRVPS
jgi:hypothetical protein